MRGGRPRRVDPTTDPGNRRRGSSTTFGHAVALTGMTIPETAAFLGISVGSARAYSLGTRDAPARVLDRLADLWLRMMLRVAPGDLPPAVANRRQAILDLRSRAWRPKAQLTRDDLEGQADAKAASALIRHLAAGRAKVKASDGDATEEEEDDDA